MTIWRRSPAAATHRSRIARPSTPTPLQRGAPRLMRRCAGIARMTPSQWSSWQGRLRKANAAALIRRRSDEHATNLLHVDPGIRLESAGVVVERAELVGL